MKINWPILATYGSVVLFWVAAVWLVRRYV